MTRRDSTTGARADGPSALPWCDYPSAADVTRHGLQALPDTLPIVDYEQAKPYRSRRNRTVEAAQLDQQLLLEMARTVAGAFARREPMVRHLQPPLRAPAHLAAHEHADPFGRARFGDWTRENLFYWLIRLVFLTDPTSPGPGIRVNGDVVAQSLATVDGEGRVIGGAFNETMPPVGAAPVFRAGDPFLGAVLPFFEPILGLLGTQDAESMAALRGRYPDFRRAHDGGKVGHHVLVARSDALPREDTFELVAATIEMYERLGHKYVVIGAVNQWTGAACQALGGVAVHFASFQARTTVRRSIEPLEGIVTSPNGYLSDKDSGSMQYVIRLR